MKMLNKENIKKMLLCLVFFIIPPIFFLILHINAISIEKKVPEKNIPASSFKIIGLSKEIPKNNPIDLNSVKYEIEFDNKMVSKFDKIARYPSFLGIQPDIIRYNVYLKHNISTKIEYSDSLNSEKKLSDLNFILACDNNSIEINNNFVLKSGLKLNDSSNNGGVYIENIIKSCLYSVYGSYKNNIGHAIYVYKLEEPNGSIILTIKPDRVSKILIFLGWIIFWFGFVILIRDGPGKLFKKNKKD